MENVFILCEVLVYMRFNTENKTNGNKDVAKIGLYKKGDQLFDDVKLPKKVNIKVAVRRDRV